MNIYLAIAAVAGIATLFGWCALAVASACDRMEATRRTLDGDEIDGGWLFDAPAPDSHHHTPRNHGEGDGVGERAFHRSGDK